MIRETLDAYSKHIMVVVSPSNGIALQRRPDTGVASEQFVNLTGIVAPRWLRLTRNGNIFTAEQSSNGIIWTSMGSFNMPMLVDAYIGLCLTSHHVNTICTAEFSNLATTGTVTGNWTSQDIGIQSNIPEQLYVALQDNAGNSAVVNNTDPLATTLITWNEWRIPLADFAGQATAGSAQTSVNPQAIKMLAIGVGDRNNPKAGGSGALYIDDIRLYRP
jgi:hypothetical protein